MGDGKPYLYAVYKTHILWSGETSLFWFFLKEIWNCKVVERNSWMISLFGCLKSQNNQGRECYVVSCLWIFFQHVQMERTYRNSFYANHLQLSFISAIDTPMFHEKEIYDFSIDSDFFPQFSAPFIHTNITMNWFVMNYLVFTHILTVVLLILVNHYDLITLSQDTCLLQVESFWAPELIFWLITWRS